MLASPTDAEWEASTAYDLMLNLIAQHGSGIGGVWAANDDMALGAIEALRVYGRAVPVTGIDGKRQAIDAIQSGMMTATVAWGLVLAGWDRTGPCTIRKDQPDRSFDRAARTPCILRSV